MVFFAFGLGESVKSCIGFASRCFYFLGLAITSRVRRGGSGLVGLFEGKGVAEFG